MAEKDGSNEVRAMCKQWRKCLFAKQKRASEAGFTSIHCPVIVQHEWPVFSHLGTFAYSPNLCIHSFTISASVNGSFLLSRRAAAVTLHWREQDQLKIKQLCSLFTDKSLKFFTGQHMNLVDLSSQLEHCLPQLVLYYCGASVVQVHWLHRTIDILWDRNTMLSEIFWRHKRYFSLNSKFSNQARPVCRPSHRPKKFRQGIKCWRVHISYSNLHIYPDHV